MEETYIRNYKMNSTMRSCNGATYACDVDSVDILGDGLEVVDDVTEVGGEDEVGDLVAEAGELLVSRLESSLDLGLQVKNEDGLIDLDTGRFY